MIKRFLSIDSKLRYVIHWFLLYILVAAIGTVITMCVTYFNNTHMQDIAYYDCQYYLETGTFNHNVSVNGAYNVIFDTSHNIVTAYPKADSYALNPRQMQRISEHLLEESSYYSLQFQPSSDLRFSIAVAYPIHEDLTFVFYRRPPFVSMTLIILYIMIGSIVCLSAIYLYMTMRLEQKTNQIQRDYVDNITHELKSPIASVLALSETMYYGLVKDPEKQKSYHKIIMNEMQGLGNTVSNMLELSKIQNGQVNCEKSPYALKELFTVPMEKYSALCKETNILLHNQLDVSDVSPMLYTNASLIVRVLDILLDNAVKFTAPTQGKIRLYYEESFDKITIIVANNGASITPIDQDKIFYRFYKGDKSHNEKGSGLGLAIAKEITEILGEKLWLKSSDTDGTSFAFTIHKYR